MDTKKRNFCLKINGSKRRGQQQRKSPLCNCQTINFNQRRRRRKKKKKKKKEEEEGETIWVEMAAAAVGAAAIKKEETAQTAAVSTVGR